MSEIKKRVAVLGAGPMGLAVAYQLIQDGYEPVIFEADDRIGGMTATFDFNGLMIERYYHFHCTSDSGFLNMLDELGLADKMRWKETKMGFYYKSKVHPWGNPMALITFPGLSWVAKLRYGFHAFLCTKRNNWLQLDQLSAQHWIRGWVGAEAYDVLWKKLFEFKFYSHADKVSAAWIWSRIRRIGRSRYNIFKEKLGYLEGGSNTLLVKIANYIEAAGGEIRLKNPATKVVIKNNELQGVDSAKGFESFKRVISTIPIPYIAKLIPDLPSSVLDKFRALENIAVVCVIVKLNKRVTENFWLNINSPEMDIPGLVEYTNLRALESHIVYVPFYMPGENRKYQDSDDVFITKVKTYIKTINQEIKDENFIDIKASRYRFSQPVCPPNFLNLLPPAQLPIKGLWVADTSYYYPEDRGISESIDYGRAMARKAMLD